MKSCVKCGVEKPLSEYHLKAAGRDGHRNDCISCVSVRNAECYRGNPKPIKERNSAYYYAHKPQKAAYARKRKLEIEYGLTQDEFDAMVLAQGGCCAICGRQSEGKFNIDHDHDTGNVRGLLCGPCNRGIGLLGDSAETLQRAVAYLERTKLGKV